MYIIFRFKALNRNTFEKHIIVSNKKYSLIYFKEDQVVFEGTETNIDYIHTDNSTSLIIINVSFTILIIV